jgi:putative transposase
MLKNHRLAKAINNMGFGMFRTMIENKAKHTSCVVTLADRYFPSSKMCCYCGAIKEDLTLKDRKYHCTKCHIVIDRDLNAAKNLEKLGVCCTSTLVDLTSDLEYSEQLKKKQEFFELEDL